MSKPSFLQRLVLAFAGTRGEAIERESREWIVTCSECGHECSYWELGGVRAGAASRGKRIRVACAECGARGWHPVQRRVAQP